ncbi:EXPA23 [Linum grandiflorum]
MASFVFPALLCLVVLVGSSSADQSRFGQLHSRSNDWSSWQYGHATFYGDKYGGETMPALSTSLFNNGLTCGACYELKCINEPNWKYCYPGARPIQITATNFCPPNPSGGWCNPPAKHFDLAMPMFLKMAPYKAGIVPVHYRRVRCHKRGGIKFVIRGNPYFNLVLIYNVGGAGAVKNVRVRGSRSGGWIHMQRNWGQNWQASAVLVGQTLSFQVVTSDGYYKVFPNVVPSNWQFGQTFEGRKNFY